MAEQTFTEMGQALDAATQLRDSSNSVSSETNSDQSGVSAGTGAGSSEGTVPNAVPVVSNTGNGNDTHHDTTGSGSQPPKTETSPSGVADGKGSPSGNADDKALDERRKYNRWQAAQRIAAKEAKKRRFAEEKARLQKEHDAYADEHGDNYNPQMANVKQDQMRELDIAQMQEAQAEWEREAYELFSPEDAATFIEDSRNLSDWINRSEPELCGYLDKPYGKHLLKGWMDKIAKNKGNAANWQRLNSFEKYRILDKYYKELEKFGEDYAAGRIGEDGKPVQTQTTQTQQQAPTQQQNQTPAVNAPVPNSGRDTNTMPPSNNFALMLQDAMNKRGVSSF